MASPLAAPFRRDRFFQLGLLLVALVVGAALLAQWLAPGGPYAGDPATAYLLPPSPGHPLGTDTQGRDVLTRVVYGARISLAVGIISQLVATSLGATGKVRLDREAPDPVDLTIVLGSDILGEASGEGTPGSTGPTTTGGG